MANTTRQTLAEALLAERDVDLSQLVATERAAGAGWQAISDDLRARYGIEISRFSLARWYSDSEKKAS